MEKFSIEMESQKVAACDECKIIFLSAEWRTDFLQKRQNLWPTNNSSSKLDER